MDTWEYFTDFIESSTKALRQSGAKGFDANTPAFSPLALSLKLNELGAQGWELVSAHPFAVGANQDVLPSMNTSTHHYFCVFKRKVKPV